MTPIVPKSFEEIGATILRLALWAIGLFLAAIVCRVGWEYGANYLI